VTSHLTIIETVVDTSLKVVIIHQAEARIAFMICELVVLRINQLYSKKNGPPDAIVATKANIEAR
jgi:hypothetical protein